MLALRAGTNPQALITTTARRLAVLRRILAEATTAQTTDTTYANQANLPPEFVAQIVVLYENTRLGRQEIYALDRRAPRRHPRRLPRGFGAPAPPPPLSCFEDPGMSRGLWPQTSPKSEIRNPKSEAQDGRSLMFTNEPRAAHDRGTGRPTAVELADRRHAYPQLDRRPTSICQTALFVGASECGCNASRRSQRRAVVCDQCELRVEKGAGPPNGASRLVFGVEEDGQKRF
jgi:hypothetical protein